MLTNIDLRKFTAHMQVEQSRSMCGSKIIYPVTSGKGLNIVRWRNRFKQRELQSREPDPFSPVLVGVAGSAAGKKDLVSLGHIPWHLQECRQIQWNPSCYMTPPKVFNFLKAMGTCQKALGTCASKAMCAKTTTTTSN